MESERLILITNPGSSSRKYALYKGMKELCSLHFEFEGKKIVYTLKSGGQKKKVATDFKALSEVAGKNLNWGRIFRRRFEVKCDFGTRSGSGCLFC